jgi:hypothetical protein
MTRFLALEFLLFLVAAGFFSACAAEEDVPDSLASDTPDTPDTSDTVDTGEIPETLETPPTRVDYEHWYDATHPTVEFTHSKEKDVANWDASIALNQPFGQKFNIRLKATLQNRENTTLQRADATDATSASLGYKLNENVRFSLNYNSSVLANWYDLSGGAPDDRKKRGGFTVASDVSTGLTDAVGLTAHFGGGATQNSYANVRNSGNQGDIAATVSYNPPASGFRASANYTGKQIFLSSELDSSGTLVLKTEDETFSQNLTFDTAFDVFPGLRVAANMRANDEQKQRPDQVAKEQETEHRKRRGVSVSSSFKLTERFTWDASVGLSRAKSRFVVRNDRNSDISNAALEGSVKIIPWAGASLSLGGKWTGTRSVYVTADTGDNIQKSLSMKYAQKMGPKADLSFSALSDLTVVAYDDKAANPKDRDMLNNRFRLNIGYKVRPRITLTVGGQYADEKSVYTQSERSASNRDTEKYRVSGSYDIQTWRNIGINQRYDISSVFTDYHFNDSKNTLVRNSSISTSINLKVVSNLRLNVVHNYKSQDQGSYMKEGGRRLYALAAESESHLLSLAVIYKVGKYLTFRVRQGFYVDTRWRYQDGVKLLDYHVRNTDISGRVGLNYPINDRSKLNFHLEHNRKEGDRVNRAFKEYWNAEVRASHVF